MTYAITAEKREQTGKRTALEQEGKRIPAILYGQGVTNQAISVGRSEFAKVYREAGSSALIDISLGADAAVKTLIKEVQVHPLTMEPIHIDFYQVRMDQEIEAQIPLNFVGESKAMKVDGGTLVKSMDEIEVRCLPANLPSSIDIDLTLLNTFDDSITIGSLKLPAGVEVLNDPELTIATVARPLTEDELKKMEESQIGDVTDIKAETEEKKEAREAEEAAEAEKGSAQAKGAAPAKNE